jgi:hypothetical protein
MEIIYALQAERFLRTCPPLTRDRILKKMRFYASAPDPLVFAEHLTDDPNAPFRYRIGKDWRVKFSVEKGVMHVNVIGRRDKIYRP